MAKPDCDDGWLPYAHELDAALAVADFTKGARIVLREVFTQIFGLAKRKRAELSPTEIGGRVGMARSHVMRGITELVGSGVLVRRQDGLYKFIKDYESWTYKGARRLSESEVVYCHSAPRIARSYVNVLPQNALPNEVTHQQSPVTSLGNNDEDALPNEVTIVTQLGNNPLPNEVTDSSSPYRNARGIKTEERIESGENSPAPRCDPRLDLNGSQPSGNVRTPEDQADVQAAIDLLASDARTERLATDVGRVHNSELNLQLEGWRWLVGAHVVTSKTDPGRYPLAYLRSAACSATAEELAKVRADLARTRQTPPGTHAPKTEYHTAPANSRHRIKHSGD